MSEDGGSIHTQLVRKGNAVVGMRRRLLRITVRSGPEKGTKLQLSDERIVLGSHPASEVVLTDRTVSRQHCEIVLVPEGWLVRDLGSTNGTYLGHVRVRSIVVDREVKLALGAVQLVVAPLDDTVDLPIAASEHFGQLRGRSAIMRRVLERLARFAPTELPILVTGESGTGKELAAQALHEASARASGPFVVVDCGALAGSLIESELFGHTKGAFTGADRARTGAFAAARGGTVFLDEIGELPIDLQPRLLGALERKQVRPLGSTQTVSVDVRIIAATNRNLRREINRGRFREDLFFRIAGATVEMPPLRAHPEDIPLYAEDLLGEASLDEETLAELGRAPWPGNVRELRNALERHASTGSVHDEPARSEQPPPVSFPLDPRAPYKTAKGLLLEHFERTYLTELMRIHAGNMNAAARAAEIDRVYLVRLLDKFGMRKR